MAPRRWAENTGWQDWSSNNRWARADAAQSQSQVDNPWNTWHEEQRNRERNRGRSDKPRNRRGQRSEAATERCIERGQLRRQEAANASAQPAAAPAAPAVEQAPVPAGGTAQDPPADRPRAVTGERAEREAPRPRLRAVEASEGAPAHLVARIRSQPSRPEPKAEIECETTHGGRGLR